MSQYTEADKNCAQLGEGGIWIPVGIQVRRKLRPYVFRYGPTIGQVRVPYYCPTNPRTPAQQAWRKVYANGVKAWQALSAADKDDWRTKATRSYMIGYTLFLQDYLLTHSPDAQPWQVGVTEVGSQDFIGYGKHWTVADSRVSGGDTIKGPPPG